MWISFLREPNPRLELGTPSLRVKCSTTELIRQPAQTRGLFSGANIVIIFKVRACWAEKISFSAKNYYFRIEIPTKSLLYDNFFRLSGPPCDGIFHLWPLSGAGLPHRPCGRGALQTPLRRRGLCSHASVAHVPHTAAQHCRHRPHLRRHHGRLLRSRGLPLDNLRRNINGRHARLHLGRHTRPQRRPEHPRDHRPLSGRRRAAVHARILGAAAHIGGSGVPALARKYSG